MISRSNFASQTNKTPETYSQLSQTCANLVNRDEVQEELDRAAELRVNLQEAELAAKRRERVVQEIEEKVRL